VLSCGREEGDCWRLAEKVLCSWGCTPDSAADEACPESRSRFSPILRGSTEGESCACPAEKGTNPSRFPKLLIRSFPDEPRSARRSLLGPGESAAAPPPNSSSITRRLAQTIRLLRGRTSA